MQKKSPGVIKLLSDLVAIDSQSYKGNKQISEHLKNLFEGYEMTTQEWVTDDDVQGQNLIVKIPGKSSEKSLVFIGHIDTVPIGDLWETNPFILEENEGKLYGRGTCDTKGGVAALLEAIFSSSEKPLFDTYLVFDGDEEVSFTGAKKYRKNLTLKNPVFICIEPTDKNLCVSTRSIIEFGVVTTGVAEHASYATATLNETNSAIYKMHKVMDVLMQDAKVLALEKDQIMGTNTQNFGVVRGGTARNVIPQECTLIAERRLLPSKNLEDELDRLKQLIKQVDPKAIFKNAFLQKGFSTSADSETVQSVLSHIQMRYPEATTTCFQAMSEATLFQDMGDVMVLGPGSIKQAHIANEYVQVEELFNFVSIFQNIIYGSIGLENKKS